MKRFISISQLVSHEVCIYILYFFGVGISLKRGWGTGNGGRGMRLTIFNKILHSEQLEGTEFIDGGSFLWLLIPPRVGTCHLSGHSFVWRTANASIFMKFHTMHISYYVFCNCWRRTVNVSISMKFVLCANRVWWIQWWQ